ncbi:class II glutamine amidotransferase [Ruegeria sediminis]|uniref:Class II glutamine amidotransferase n=1 Tax=Ruegeria sediminis TaxID=2583820 RepID=A0ABY2WVH7_9RHOB|nr:class II glutamine amidotransferase [Ruegeria sediminis]TMV06762.1 class II glutamine amidotransferase [Ruegeria sediminis]
MCRFVAYSGPDIPLENIVILPQHSLLNQSQHAAEAKLAVNGDGFGMAWYSDQERPGLYRDVLPAWSDRNLVDLCRMINSRLFLAHVRASTFGETSRSNCHPFACGRWSFMHNGQIGDFARVRRRLEASLNDEHYASRRGSTDSELLFLLLLTNGLDHSPYEAVVRTIRQIEEIQGEISQPNRLTASFCDGQVLYAFRYSSDRHSPSLYFGQGLDHGGKVIASEPLDRGTGTWEPIADRSFFTLAGGAATTQALPF